MVSVGNSLKELGGQMLKCLKFSTGLKLPAAQREAAKKNQTLIDLID